MIKPQGSVHARGVAKAAALLSVVLTCACSGDGDESNAASGGTGAVAGKAGAGASAGSSNSGSGGAAASGSGGQPGTGGGGNDSAGASGSVGMAGASPTPVAVPACDPNEAVAASAIFAAADGASDGAGSEANPLSLDAALLRLAPGTTLYLRGGEYRRKGTVTVGTSGTADQPIVIKAYRCEKAILDCTGCAEDGAFVAVFGDHVVVEDLEIRNSNAWGALTAYRSHITFRRNVLYGHLHSVINAYQWNGPAPHHLLFEGNVVHDSVLHNVAGDRTGGWNNAISSSFPNTVIRGNVVYHNHGEGIIVGGEGPTLVQGNVCYDNFATQI
jgi:hypothetical protein